jgi:hypothetical protein
MTSIRSLPPELILSVCEGLVNVYNKRADLAAFARTTKYCYDVVNSVLYRECGELAVGWGARRGHLEPLKHAFHHAKSPAERLRLLNNPIGIIVDLDEDDQYYCESCVDFHVVDPDPREPSFNAPALVIASRYGHDNIVSYLLDQGADITVSHFGLCDCPHLAMLAATLTIGSIPARTGGYLCIMRSVRVTCRPSLFFLHMGLRFTSAWKRERRVSVLCRLQRLKD